MPRNEACLPAIDDNSADLRARALRVYQFARDFPPARPRTSSHSLPNLKQGPMRCPALTTKRLHRIKPQTVRSHRVCKGSSIITFRRMLIQGPLVVG